MPIRVSPFTNLPPLLKTIIDKEETVDVNIEIANSNKLTDEQGDKMMGVIRKILFKTITPRELLETVKHDIGLSDAKAKVLTLDLLGRRFLPMEWYIGDVKSLIKEMDGDVERFLVEAQQRYPEVYAPQEAKTETDSEEVETILDNEPPILRDFEDRLTSFRGRAEILLRLTGLSGDVEEAMKTGALTKEAGEKLLQQLDSLSYAINTKDLNPFEVQSLHRKLSKVLQQIPQS